MNLAHLFSRVVVTTPGGCWVWTGRLSDSGYPLAQSGGKKNVRVHRLVWSWMAGPIPDGLMVLHHCDNRKCINPAHLFVGDHKDNFHDALKKGRTIGQYGETHNKAKLKIQQVLEIRRLYDAIPAGFRGRKLRIQGRGGVTEIAEKFGVTIGQVCQIGRRHLWKQVPEEDKSMR